MMEFVLVHMGKESKVSHSRYNSRGNLTELFLWWHTVHLERL